MNVNKRDLISENSIFGWLAVITGVILSLPYMAMKYDWRIPDPGSSISTSVNWSTSDFVIMGGLIYSMGSVFILAARKVGKRNRLAAAVITGILFLYIWAELAVGIFTNLGS